MQRCLALIFLFFILNSAYADVTDFSAARTACNLALRKNAHSPEDGYNPAVARDFMRGLSRDGQKLFSRAIGEGGVMNGRPVSPEDFSRYVLSKFEDHDRDAIYDVLGFSKPLRAECEHWVEMKLADDRKPDWARRTQITLALAIGIWSVSGVVSDYRHRHAQSPPVPPLPSPPGETVEDLALAMAEMNLGSPDQHISQVQLANAFHLTEGLQAWPQEVDLGERIGKYKLRIKSNLLTGESAALYEATSPDQVITQIRIGEDVVKHVHDGFSIVMGSSAVLKAYYYTPLGAVESKKGGVLRNWAPEKEFAFMAPASEYQKLLPEYFAHPPAATPGDFDIKYAKNIVGNESLIAVVDSGIDFRRKDLASHVARNKGEIAGDGIDNDHNGYIDDVAGFDFFSRSPNTQVWRNSYHGAKVSEVAIRGSARIKILPLKIGDSVNVANSPEIFDYIRNWNRDNPTRKIRVVNFSFSTSSGDASANIYRGIKSLPDVIFVASAGNDREGSERSHSFPAEWDLPNVFSVGSLNARRSAIYWTSGHGKNTQFLADGENVVVKNYLGKDEPATGTSFAAPRIGNIIAKMLLLAPELSPANVSRILSESLTDSEKFTGEAQFPGIIDEDLAFAKSISFHEALQPHPKAKRSLKLK